ncbi:MAG: LamG domain-containing protein, partial [Campylobacterota bacterium]|nr:LamG domain-containing protein [Campylobacterota bacterium]
MRNLFALLLLNLSLFAYIEDFNNYTDGTQSSNLNASGITFSSHGRWEVFSTPFSIFDTPVLLEPSSSSGNSPITLSFDESQCNIAFNFATDGEDTLNIIGLYNGKEVYTEQLSGDNKGGSYVSNFELINTKLDAIELYTEGKKRLLIDTVQTSGCTMDDYSISGLLAHYGFETNSTSAPKGIIGSALRLDTSYKISQEKKLASIALWFKADSIQNNPLIMQSGIENENRRVRLSINQDALLQLDIADALMSPLIPEKAIEANIWTHLALTRELDNLNVYINGVLHGSYAVSLDLYEQDEQFEIGEANFGLIDELRVYERELSSSEVMELFHTRETF